MECDVAINLRVRRATNLHPGIKMTLRMKHAARHGILQNSSTGKEGKAVAALNSFSTTP
jgi:hypothetical protein